MDKKVCSLDVNAAITTESAYRTSDGERFLNRADAVQHEKVLRLSDALRNEFSTQDLCEAEAVAEWLLNNFEINDKAA